MLLLTSSFLILKDVFEFRNLERSAFDDGILIAKVQRSLAADLRISQNYRPPREAKLESSTDLAIGIAIHAGYNTEFFKNRT